MRVGIGWERSRVAGEPCEETYHASCRSAVNDDVDFPSNRDGRLCRWTVEYRCE